MSSRIVLDSNNLWLMAWTDRTISVLDPGRDLNIHNIPNTIGGSSRQVARVGSAGSATHRELQVYGVVFSGKQLEDLSVEIINHQLLVNREGFMIMYFNVGAPHMYLTKNGQPSISLMRRLNDLFDWSKYGVKVPIPVGTVWDRFQLNNGTLMVGNREKAAEVEKAKEELAEAKRELAESEKKRAEEVKAKEEEIAKKDAQIKALKNAMQALIG